MHVGFPRWIVAIWFLHRRCGSQSVGGDHAFLLAGCPIGLDGFKETAQSLQLRGCYLQLDSNGGPCEAQRVVDSWLGWLRDGVEGPGVVSVWR